MARKTDAEVAEGLADAATAAFRNAHDQLTRASDLFAQAEESHRDQARAHLEQANACQQAREKHEKVRDNIAGLLS